VDLLNRAMNLAFGAIMGDPDLVNKEGDLIQAVTAEGIQAMAYKILVPTNCSTLHYKAKESSEEEN
jgi:zinc protease